MQEQGEPGPRRRRRRAVGPPSAPTAQGGTDAARWHAPPEDEPAPEDTDERLRREVPPHHGD